MPRKNDHFSQFACFRKSNCMAFMFRLPEVNHLLDSLQASEEVDTSHLRVSHPIRCRFNLGNSQSCRNNCERPVERYCKISKLKHNFRLPNRNQAISSHALPVWAESEKMEALMDVEKRKMMEIAANSHINCKKFGATS